MIATRKRSTETGLPRWFEACLREAQGKTIGLSELPKNYSHLGEQLALRIEEVVRPEGVVEWQRRVSEWNDPAWLEEGQLGEKERDLLSFLERECSPCMERIPRSKRIELLRGIWRKTR